MSHLESLLRIIVEVLEEAGRKPNKPITEQTLLREDLGMDSLELAVLTVKIEAQFGVDVFASGLVTTVGEILEKLKG